MADRGGDASPNKSKAGTSMEGKREDLRRRLNFLALVLLILGLAGAVVIYRAAGNTGSNPSDTIGYEEGEGDGSTYAIRPEDSKSYQRDMELYGGEANLLADDLRRWFIGLWQGKSLAYTVGCISLFASLAVFGTANYVVPFLDEDENEHGA